VQRAEINLDPFAPLQFAVVGCGGQRSVAPTEMTAKNGPEPIS
jgi:hypothetical protein